MIAVRRSRITSAQAQLAAAFADGLPIEFDPQAAGVGALFMAASSHGLTAYDAIYLQLAVLRGGDLLTADSALAQAAQRAGITVQGAELSR
jgi:predicted nucleic acid-binding protein